MPFRIEWLPSALRAFIGPRGEAETTGRAVRLLTRASARTLINALASHARPALDVTGEQ